MKTKLMLALLPALLAAPVQAKSDAEQSKELEQARQELQAARDELKRAAQELARISREQGRESPRAFAYEFMADENRGMLGIIMGHGPVEKGQIKGVRVSAVTPGSGADKAGLKAGDVIVAVRGESIATAEDGDTTPGRKLRQGLRDLKVGDPVKIAYERDGKRSEVTVTASRPEQGRFEMPVPPVPPLPPMPPLMAFEDDVQHDILLPYAPGRVRLEKRLHGGWELVSLDQDLAPYFKTKDGVLVAKAEPDNKLGLKSGDVIQKFNGEAVKSPKDVMKRLGRLEPGAELKLEVVRAGKSETLKGKAPERERREVHRRIEIETDAETP